MKKAILAWESAASSAEFRNRMLDDVIEGLLSDPKRLSSRYIYDSEGSRLFGEIMKLDEYYLTRSEDEILRSSAAEISATLGGEAFRLVELGAGNGSKTAHLIKRFIRDDRDFIYSPIDISIDALESLDENFVPRFPSLRCKGVVAEYFRGLEWLEANNRQKNLILFLGSNIGNFNPAKRKGFLEHLYGIMKKGDLLLVGFDLQKDLDVLLPAYNDSKGITRKFNMNLLIRINRELGGHFNAGKFEFYSTYNPLHGAVESFLISKEKQNVRVDAAGMNFEFDAWEPVHTESSYKYRLGQIDRIGTAHEFKPLQKYTDEKEYFVDVLWKK